MNGENRLETGKGRSVELSGKVVVVTGASSGIGLAVARAFAREGCRVAIGARREDRLADAQRQIENDGAEALSLVTDVRTEADAQALVRAAYERWGSVDILVNNAGFATSKPFLDMSAVEVRDHMETNYMGAVYSAKAALEYMMPQRSGHIINIASVLAKIPAPHLAAYSATKAALDSLSTSLRAELSRYGIQVTAVHPSVTRTEFYHNTGFDNRARRAAHLFAQEPETVARAVVRAARRPRAEVYPLFGTRLLPVIHAVFSPLVRLGLKAISRVYR